MAETINEKELSPQEYFEIVKGKKQQITDGALRKVYDNCLELLNKYKITGQKNGMEKLLFHLECIEKEREIVSMGINTFVYRDDIEYYINNVASDIVKIIELERYEREIPDEIVDVIANVKDKFDQLYIVFTDYTGGTARKVKAERIAKDPILFGTFLNKSTRSVVDRFYYLGDWIDEYCNLTLDKMVNESSIKGKRNITHTISTPQDIEELKKQLNLIEKDKDGLFRLVVKKDDGFFKKISTFFSKKK